MDTTFLDNIYSGTTGYVYLWTPQKKLSYPFAVSQTADMLDKAAALTAQHLDVFYSLGVMRSPLKSIRYRAKQEEIYQLSTFWADIDIADAASHAKGNLPPDISSALSLIPDNLPPSVVVSSGHGLHVYWLLDRPVTIESVAAGDEEVRTLARSFGAATHIVRGAGVYELDQTYGLTVLEPLCGLTAQAIVAYGLSAQQEDEMFAEPYMQVAFDYKNGGDTAEHFVLRFLPAAEDGSLFYANAQGSGVVYVIERKAFFDISYEKLLLRWFLSPLLMDVTGVTVVDGARTYAFAVDNTDAKNPVVTLDGAPLDVELFRSFYQLLGSAANDGTYLGEQPAPEGTAAMTITYHYGDGKADDVMALYPGESRRVNVYVNGVCEFAMRDAFVQRVQEALSALEAGESFDINW